MGEGRDGKGNCQINEIMRFDLKQIAAKLVDAAVGVLLLEMGRLGVWLVEKK